MSDFVGRLDLTPRLDSSGWLLKLTGHDVDGHSISYLIALGERDLKRLHARISEILKGEE